MPPKTYGYARVSARDQNLDRQIDALMEFGIERHEYDRSVSLFDTTLTREDYEDMRRRDLALGSDGLARDRRREFVVHSVEERPARSDGEPDRVTLGVQTLSVRPVETTEERETRAREAKAAEEARRSSLAAGLDALGAGDVVRHKAFGEGRVKSISGGKIVVRIGGKERQFVFPDAFEQGFLSL